MDLFPCEIWEEVAKRLPAYDLINFCRSAPEFFHFLRQRRVVTHFDLEGCFDSYAEPLFKFIACNVAFEHVKYLNINRIYWLGLEEARDIVRLMPKLEELRAIDTILGMRNDDVILYKKLKVLAISVEADQFTSSREVYRENLAQLRSLCIKFLTKYKANFRRIYYMFFNELRGLDELWIYDADALETQPIRYDYIVCNLRSLKRLVIKSKMNLTLLDYRPFGLLKIFERRRPNVTTIVYVKRDFPQLIAVRKPSLSEICESRTEKSWQVVQSFLSEVPCDFRTAIDVANAKTIKNFEFNELSFYHSRCCHPTFVNAAIDILLSKRCKSLKRLCLTFCILQEGNFEQKEKKNVLRHIINNCQYLTTLEILACSEQSDPLLLDVSEDFSRNQCVKVPCYSSAIIGAYDLVSHLKYLQKLVLEIPPYSNGNFLTDVFLKCPELQSLQLLSRDANEDLNSALYSHLNYVQNLKDFRLETVHVDLDRLFSALNKVSISKLQRVVIKCDYEHSTQLWPVEKLLKRNSDVVLLVILVSKYNRHQMSKLQELLDSHKDHPAKIYVARTTIDPEDDVCVPEAHKDILYFESAVAALHFSDF